jgi:2-desacetyl-2-hydroxyethyl bacteriochlorophyllide A dehydrogenase
MTQRQCAYFVAPHQVETRSEALDGPGPEDVLVRTLVSAISPGTESLVYQGLFPEGLSLDASLSTLGGEFAYPLKYGYCAAGEVIACGEHVGQDWLGKTVFAFNPHESHFIAPAQAVMPLPTGLTPEEAVFLPTMETAVNFVMDGAPLIGERVAVIGQGIVGLLTTALLSCFPLAELVSLDRYELRRQASVDLGAHASLSPDDPDLPQDIDLCYELSGSPAALDTAIALTGFDGRILVGSWYGQKRAPINLGGRFHRSRIHLISSQVSTLASHLTGRWSKARRFAVTWEMLRQVRPARLVTHRYPIEQAAEAYRQIDNHPEQTIQVLLTYS